MPELPTKPDRGFFETSIRIRDLFYVLTLVAATIGVYYNSQVQIGKLQARIEMIDQQNLPPRVSALEAQNKDLRDGLRMLHQDLVHVGDLVAAKK